MGHLRACFSSHDGRQDCRISETLCLILVSRPTSVRRLTMQRGSPSVYLCTNHRAALPLLFQLLVFHPSRGLHWPQLSQLVMFPAKCHSVSLSSSMGSMSRFAFMKTVSYGWTFVPR